LGVHCGCTGRQSACRTASNIDRVASRLGFRSPDRLHAQRPSTFCPERYLLYAPHLSLAQSCNRHSTSSFLAPLHRLCYDVSAQPHKGALRSRQCTAVLGAAIESWTPSSTFSKSRPRSLDCAQVLVVRGGPAARKPLPFCCGSGGRSVRDSTSMRWREVIHQPLP
jgi:hypothetical protein